MSLRTGFEIRFRKGTKEISNCKISSGPVSKVKVKVRQSRYRPGQAQRILKKLRFPDFVTAAQDGGKVVSLTHRPPLPPRKFSWYSFLLEAGSTPGP